MRIYLYVCKSCGHETEEESNDLTGAECALPSCTEGTIRRKFVIGGVVFKGSGFYSTDK